MHPLAEALLVICGGGTIPVSQLSAACHKEAMATLIAGGLIESQKSGAGRVFVTRNASVLRLWVEKQFPYTTGRFSATTPGALNLLTSRSTKSAKRKRAQEYLHVVTSEPFRYTRGGVTLDLAEPCRTHGAATLVVQDREPWGLLDPFVMVEQPELLQPAARLLGMAAVCYNGKASDLVLAALARGARCLVWIAPDYDPVGLNEYIRFKEALGPDRLRLYRPVDLEALFAQFSDKKLMRKENSQRMLRNIDLQAHPEVAEFVDLIKNNNAGLEQEAILVRNEADERAPRQPQATSSHLLSSHPDS